MDHLGAKRCCWLVSVLTLSGLSGCADGPFPALVSLNPTMRRQWAEDEQYQPTLHRQMAEIKALQASARSLSPGQKQHWSGEMTHIVQSHPNALLRAAAVETLGDLRTADGDEGLRIALKDADASVRIAACQAWGKRGNQESVERLAETLGSDSNVDVRLAAARELGRFSDSVAYQALSLALEGDDPALQYRAVESLKRASGKDYGHNYDAWQRFAQGQDPGPEYTPSLAERVRELF